MEDEIGQVVAERLHAACQHVDCERYGEGRPDAAERDEQPARVVQHGAGVSQPFEVVAHEPQPQRGGVDKRRHDQRCSQPAQIEAAARTATRRRSSRLNCRGRQRRRGGGQIGFQSCLTCEAARRTEKVSASLLLAGRQ